MDGQPHFLHPVNIKMLRREFGGFEQFPAKITGKVLEVEDLLVSEVTHQRMKFLNHLAKGVTAYLVEVDLGTLCSAATYEAFRGEVSAM